MLWKGILCTNAQPQCSGSGGGQNRVTISQDFQHALDEPIPEFFLASQFKEIPVALDNNYFVRNRFDGATLKWRGGHLYMAANSYGQCVLELPEGKNLPPGSELNGKCTLVRKSKVTVEFTVVGSPKGIQTSGCAKQNPNGGVALTRGGNCGSGATITLPSPQQP